MEKFRPYKKNSLVPREKHVPRTKWSILLKWLMLNYFRPYVSLLCMTFLCMLMASVFNAGSLAFIKPVLEVILIPEKAEIAMSKVAESDINSEHTQELPKKQRSIGKTALDKMLRPLNEFTLKHSRGNPFGMLCVVAAMLIVVFFFKALFTFLQDYFMRYISEGVIRTLREDVYRHILELPLSHFTGTGTGKLMSFLNYDIILCKNVVNVVFERAIFQPLQILALLAWAMLLNWQLTLASVLVIPVSGIVVSVVGKKLRRARYKSQQKLSDLNSILHETFSAIRIVRAFRMEDYEKSRFESKAREIFRIAVKMARVRSAAGPAVEWLGAFGVALILLLGGYIVIISKTMDGSDFMTYVLALGMMYTPLKRLVKANSEFQEGLAGAERVHSLLHEDIPIKNEPSLPELPPFESTICFDNASFNYHKDAEKALDGVSFSVDKGQTIALVGHSGAGKSTTMDLLMRFHDVTDGRITIDGKDIRHVQLNSLRRQIGLVPQDVILFNDTIRSNIAYGCDDASQEEVEQAARLANAHDFITSFSEGYDTMVGERGAQLSGGQAQRISIARALFKNPPILIFDEATSSLDSESELLIRKAMENLIRNRTTFIIAHRLSTVLHADQIIVLDRAKVGGIGKHEELLNSNLIYRRLYELQFKPER